MIYSQSITFLFCPKKTNSPLKKLTLLSFLKVRNMEYTESLRIKREKNTIRVMIQMYCNAHHNTSKGELCDQCNDILNYSYKRIEKCVFKNKKPACQTCPIHCFRIDYKQNIRKIMRYSGPRMLLRHPIKTILHYIDVLRGKQLSKQWLKIHKPKLGKLKQEI